MQDNIIIDMTSEGFKAYRSEHNEESYQLIDVREIMEYKAAHIPGAHLLPLSDEQTMLNELYDTHKDLIFYCRSGHRSRIAADYLTEYGSSAAHIYNLAGGISAFNGSVLPDFPRVVSFKKEESLPEMIQKSMNMEKGAFRFYQYIHDQSGLSVFFKNTVSTLMTAEEEHAKALYRILESEIKQTDPFEKTFSDLNGDILEGGMSYDEALQNIEKMEEDREVNFLETALLIEYAAYDLYRNIADMKGIGDRAPLFTNIAQQEKTHITLIADSLGKLH